MIATYDSLSYRTDDRDFLNSIQQGTSEPYPRELQIVKRFQALFPERTNTFVDVGGHIGTVSLPYSRLFQHVIAYEPNPTSYQFFLENIALNKIQNVQVKHMGVSNKRSTCKVVSHPGGNSGCFYTKESDGEHSVPLIPLDEESFPAPIDFLKIDTEGSELLVLQGAKQCIERWHPLIQVETNHCSSTYFGYDSKEIHTFLGNLGYIVLDTDGNNPLFYVP